ncbi:hypothetical protein [Aureimonas glaciei]|uniref:Uncharacterized protein n=1 Tax=Aureimonas glaciei TaxID=1776957 RepID=A0A916XUC6_9HYPH|nr:hypothetical protein [Aureimonas glaciei]GGD12827.1 hypothetical protein GCM10011335_14580 [Aureimonas glaciei]
MTHPVCCCEVYRGLHLIALGANLAVQQKGWATEKSGGEGKVGDDIFFSEKRFSDPDRLFQRFGMGPRVKPEDDYHQGFASFELNRNPARPREIVERSLAT